MEAGYEPVLLSDVPHEEDREIWGWILPSVFEALVPGGLGVFHGVQVDPDRAGPLRATVQSPRQLPGGAGRSPPLRKRRPYKLGETAVVAAKVVALWLLNGGSIIMAEKAAL